MMLKHMTWASIGQQLASPMLPALSSQIETVYAGHITLRICQEFVRVFGRATRDSWTGLCQPCCF